jgi:hypothetical protein
MPPVNSATTHLTPSEGMVQLGLALKCLIAIMAANCHKGNPFCFAKLEIKGCFWCMAVCDDDAWNFCYVLPSDIDNIDVNKIKIVVPNAATNVI